MDQRIQKALRELERAGVELFLDAEAYQVYLPDVAAIYIPNTHSCKLMIPGIREFDIHGSEEAINKLISKWKAAKVVSRGR